MTSILMLNQSLLLSDEPMIGLDTKSARIRKKAVGGDVQPGAKQAGQHFTPPPQPRRTTRSSWPLPSARG